MQLTVRRFDAGADVEPLPAAGVAGRPDERVHDVVDEDIVAGVAAVPEDLGGLTREQRLGEDRHHAGLAVRILARAIHIRRGDVRAVQAVQVAEGVQVDLARHLARGIRRRGVGRHRLGSRVPRRGAVDGSARGGVHDLADMRPAGRLGQAHRADDVDRGVELRVGHRVPHVDLGGQVEHHLRAVLVEDGLQVGRHDVGLDEDVRRIVGQVLQVGRAAGGEVVQPHHRMTVG